MASSYSPEVKAAVMAALLAGQSVSSVADEYRLPRGTVSSWKQKSVHFIDEASAMAVRNVGPLVLEYLAANLRALRAQAEVFADPEWLKQQPANELAVLHGVMTDKAIRLLEALGEPTED